MKLVQLAVAGVLVSFVAAHSYLTYPEPEGKGYCRANHGCKPCQKPRRTKFSETNVAATWKRGQKVRYSYLRNNHDQGFARLSIIPTKYRGDLKEHEKFAFMYHCFGVNAQKCPNKASCGADRTGLRYSADFVVPSAIPDGVYHFSWAFYGGGGPGIRGVPWSFTTFYSCAIIKIEGGDPVQSSSPVKFAALKGTANAPGKCATHALRSDECATMEATSVVIARAKEYCPNKPLLQAVPPQFAADGKPKVSPISSSMFEGSQEFEATAAAEAPKSPGREKPKHKKSKKRLEFERFCRKFLGERRSRRKRWAKRRCTCRRILGLTGGKKC